MHKFSNLKVIFTDIHGTILPNYGYLIKKEINTDSYYTTAKDEFEKLNKHCITNNIKLVVVSGGNLLELNELSTFFNLDISAYYGEQGAIHSLDGGKTWKINESIENNLRQQYLDLIDLFKREIPQLEEISTSVSFKLVYSCKTSALHYKELYLQLKAIAHSKGMFIYPLSEYSYLIVKSYINKYEAMKHYLQTYNIEEEDALFYGNGANDLDAFIQGKHHKLVSTTPQFYFHVDNSYESLIAEIPAGIDKLIYGLTKHLGL